MSERLQEVVDSENSSFSDACRQTYVDAARELGITASLDECVIVVGSSPVKKYAQAAAAALQAHAAVLVVGKADKLGKAVTVAEVAKSGAGAVVQYNRTALHSSLVNPAYKPAASAKNVQAFFGDDEDDEAISTASVLRELRGPKVYKVPAISILLVKAAKPNTLTSWTKQAA